MSIISKVCMAVTLISFLFLLASFVINNYKTIKNGSVIMLIAVMLLSLTGICVSTDHAVFSTAQEHQSLGYAQGYNDCIQEVRHKIKVTNVSYNSIDLTFPDGLAKTYSFKTIQDDEYEEGYGSVKTYEDYRCITSPTASQTKLNNLECVYTDSNGFRKIYDYYLVALGSYYGSIGDIYHVTLSTGRHIFVIKGDSKADKHTDISNRIHLIDGSVIEFIVDSNILKQNLGSYGDCSYIPGYDGYITNMELVDHYNF